MCPFILSLVIVGAVESEPGWISIEYLQQGRVEEVVVQEGMYVDCLARGFAT